MSKFPGTLKTEVIFIDIDGTLTDKALSGGQPILERIEAVRKMIADGAEIVIWSGGGTEYARWFCKLVDLEPMAAIGKPRLALDDNPKIRPRGVIGENPDVFFRRK